jgi:hypothetical protein
MIMTSVFYFIGMHMSRSQNTAFLLSGTGASANLNLYYALPSPARPTLRLPVSLPARPLAPNQSSHGARSTLARQTKMPATMHKDKLEGGESFEKPATISHEPFYSRLAIDIYAKTNPQIGQHSKHRPARCRLDLGGPSL